MSRTRILTLFFIPIVVWGVSACGAAKPKPKPQGMPMGVLDDRAWLEGDPVEPAATRTGEDRPIEKVSAFADGRYYK